MQPSNVNFGVIRRTLDTLQFVAQFDGSRNEAELAWIRMVVEAALEGADGTEEYEVGDFLAADDAVYQLTKNLGAGSWVALRMDRVSLELESLTIEPDDYVPTYAPAEWPL